MSHPKELPAPALQCYATAAYPCSYLPGRLARSQVVAAGRAMTADAYTWLVGQGFRRSGLFTYRPHCGECAACVPVRVEVERFAATRSQRRAWRRHAGLRARVMALDWQDDHYALYRRYQARRHPGGGMDEDSASQYAQFLLASQVETQLVEFRDADASAGLPGTLRMVAIFDVLADGLSSVYTFYDPDMAGSLGTYGILWQIARCRELRLPWLNLGYWIRESRKMAYKSRFQPAQARVGGRWMDFRLAFADAFAEATV